MPETRAELCNRTGVPNGSAYMLSTHKENMFEKYLNQNGVSFTPDEASKAQSPILHGYLNKDDTDTYLNYIKYVNQKYDDGVPGWNKSHIQNALILLRNADELEYQGYIICLTDETFLPPSGVSWVVQRT